jgi:hypothetical protein
MHEVPARVDHKLYFLHVHLAMRHFYLGAMYGISPKSLNYSQRREFAGLKTLFQIQAKICQRLPSLLVRIQEIMLLGSRRIPGNPTAIPPQFLRICAHVFRWMRSTYVQILDSINRRISCCKGRCEICNTHFELERRVLSGDIVLVLTRWLDLGPGLSPDDRQWKAFEHSATKEVLHFVSTRVAFEPTSSKGSHEDSILRGVSYLIRPREEDIKG